MHRLTRHLSSGGYLGRRTLGKPARYPSRIATDQAGHLPPAVNSSDAHLELKSAARKIRVLVVDDSALARRAISDALARDPEIEVVGAASDPYVARDEILALQPDVITLDLEMPRMDGLTFLKILQEHYPVPVVVVSSLTPSGSAKALEALEAGALDVLAKPDGSGSLGQLAHQLALSCEGGCPLSSTSSDDPRRPLTPPVPAAPSIRPGEFSSRRVILIGASTGGVEALRFLLPRLPDGLPPIVVVQHIPANFSRALANHLNDLCPFQVREAVDGEELTNWLVPRGAWRFSFGADGRWTRLSRPIDSVTASASLPTLGGYPIPFRSGARR